jgi:hypothetical protein
VRLKKILKNKRILSFSEFKNGVFETKSAVVERRDYGFSEILQASVIFRLHMFCILGPRSPGAPREVLQAP